MLYRLSYGSIDGIVLTSPPKRRALCHTRFRDASVFGAGVDAAALARENRGMSKGKPPGLSERGRDEAAERARRQAEALRANLARRKAQTRARDSADGDACPGEGHTVQDPDT